MEDQEDRTPQPDGSEPVHEHPPESPGPGRTMTQYLVLAVGALIVLAALLWFLVPLTAG